MRYYTESFDRPYPYSSTGNVSPFEAQFVTDDRRKILVKINIVKPSLSPIRDGRLVAYATFTSDGGGSGLSSILQSIKSLVRGRYSATGQGDQFRILATVAEILTTYLKTREIVSYLSFDVASDDTSRIKLYDRMLRRFKVTSEVKMIGGRRLYLVSNQW